MRKNLGFGSFEFYLVIIAIGIILIVGIQRYNKLAREAQRLSVEILSQNFSAAVHNYHNHWMVAQQLAESNQQLKIDNSIVQFSMQGWPLEVSTLESPDKKITLSSCLSLWNAFLQNPPSISVVEHDLSGSQKYHLSLTPEGNCRFGLLKPKTQGVYFEYSPFSGQVKTFSTL